MGVSSQRHQRSLTAGRAKGGEMVSCFLLRVEDNMESIGRAVNSSLQLSKRGGGVGLLLTNLREMSAPIKNIPGTHLVWFLL